MKFDLQSAAKCDVETKTNLETPASLANWASLLVPFTFIKYAKVRSFATFAGPTIAAACKNRSPGLIDGIEIGAELLKSIFISETLLPKCFPIVPEVPVAKIIYVTSFYS
jgi:hypothetical protein